MEQLVPSEIVEHMPFYCPTILITLNWKYRIFCAFFF